MGNSQDTANAMTKSEPSRPKGKSQLIIKSHTWSRDSHGLFDYEGKNLAKKNLKTHHGGLLARNGDEIHLIKDKDKNARQEEKELLKFVTKEGSFWVASCLEPEKDKTNKDGINVEDNPENFDNGLWLVVKSIRNANNKGYPLAEGDMMKLGRIKFRIKEMQGSPVVSSNKHIKTEVENEHSSDVSIAKSHDSIKVSSLTSIQTCRICLSESSEPGNPFFSPCHCSGTMKYVHVKCLQRWLKSKLHIKESGQSTSIYWKTLECELCKTGYPNTFTIKDQKYDIVEIDRPSCAYLMLEVLSKDRNMARGIHIIKMENKNNIRLGRGHDSDIRITDISVSRCHALIKLDKGTFYLEDNNSKFGTLVNIKKSFPITGAYKNVSLQVGRTLVTVTVKKSKTFFPVCFSQNVNLDSSDDEVEAHSDGEDRIETEHNAPSRNSHNIISNRNSNEIFPVENAENLQNDNNNIHIENIEEINQPEVREEQPEVRDEQPSIEINQENAGI